MNEISNAGFLTALNCRPLLPGLSDSEEQIEEMISSAKNFGADYVLAAGLTLFGEGRADSKTLYFKYLEKYQSQIIEATKNIYQYKSFPNSEYNNGINKLVQQLCKKSEIL